MITAISRGCRGTLADGTTRYIIEVQPADRIAAATLFGEPGSPVVLARLMPVAAHDLAQKETIASHEKQIEPNNDALPVVAKGGKLSNWAARRCTSADFLQFIIPIYDKWMGGDGTGCGDVTPECVGGTEQYCRHAILVICDIESRAELDNDERARKVFDEKIRLPFIDFCERRA